MLEDGAVAFDLGQAKYSISGDYNKCLLHLWSAERNTVRRVLDAEVKNGVLKLAVQRLGQSRPTRLEICRERDRRSPSAKKAARIQLRTEAATRSRPALSRLCRHPPYNRHGPGKLFRADLFPWTFAERPVGVRRAGSQRLGNASLHRCRADLRHPLARSVPPFLSRKVSCRGTALVRPRTAVPRSTRERMAQPESGSRQMEFV